MTADRDGAQEAHNVIINILRSSERGQAEEIMEEHQPRSQDPKPTDRDGGTIQIRDKVPGVKDQQYGQGLPAVTRLS